MPGEEFEWDAAKAASNFAKHHISFAAARDVFRDAFALERHDLASHHEELRYIITGDGPWRAIDRGLYGARGANAHHLRSESRYEQHEYYRNQTAG
jgi:uncharacterized DUF497 family protein